MERRVRPRTPGWTYGIVRWDTGDHANAIVWDLSDGGVAVEVATDSPSSQRFLLALSCDGMQIAFPLEVAGRDLLDGRPLIHARFGVLSDHQKSVLVRLLADWQQSMDDRTLWLTTRRDDRARRTDLHLPGDVRGPRPDRRAS